MFTDEILSAPIPNKFSAPRVKTERVHVAPSEVDHWIKMQGKPHYTSDGTLSFSPLWNNYLKNPNVQEAFLEGAREHYRSGGVVGRKAYATGGHVSDADKGRFGDTMEVEMPTSMTKFLDNVLQRACGGVAINNINPRTGKKEYFLGALLGGLASWLVPKAMPYLSKIGSGLSSLFGAGKAAVQSAAPYISRGVSGIGNMAMSALPMYSQYKMFQNQDRQYNLQNREMGMQERLLDNQFGPQSGSYSPPENNYGGNYGGGYGMGRESPNLGYDTSRFFNSQSPSGMGSTMGGGYQPPAFTPQSQIPMMRPTPSRPNSAFGAYNPSPQRGYSPTPSPQPSMSPMPMFSPIRPQTPPMQMSIPSMGSPMSGRSSSASSGFRTPLNGNEGGIYQNYQNNPYADFTRF